MTAPILMVGMVALLLLLRQPLIVILLSICAVVQYVWGKGQFDYIIEDMWVAPGMAAPFLFH